MWHVASPIILLDLVSLAANYSTPVVYCFSMLFFWPRCIRQRKNDAPKTVHIVLGFFFIVNFCLGIGVLGIPYAFFYTGLIAAFPTLLIVSVVSWVNANYLLEIMARAQVRNISHHLHLAIASPWAHRIIYLFFNVTGATWVGKFYFNPLNVIGAMSWFYE